MSVKTREQLRLDLEENRVANLDPPLKDRLEPWLLNLVDSVPAGDDFFFAESYDTIQDAVDDAEAQGGGKVVIPNSTIANPYEFVNPLTLGANGSVTLIGRGIGNAIVKKNDDHGIIVAGGSSEQKVVIRDLHVEGLQESDDPNNNTGANENYPGIVSRGKVFIDNVMVEHCGGPNYPGTAGAAGCYAIGIVTDESNANYSRIRNTWVKSCYGDAVFVGREGSGTVDSNALHIDLRASNLNLGFAVNIDEGFQNYVNVQHASGSQHTAVVRFGHARNNCDITYIESDVPAAVQFDAQRNVARVMRSDHLSSRFIDNSANWVFIDLAQRKTYTDFRGWQYENAGIEIPSGSKAKFLDSASAIFEESGGHQWTVNNSSTEEFRVWDKSNTTEAFLIQSGIPGPLDYRSGGQLRFQVLSSAPPSPANGDIAYADGTGWDPAGDGTSGFFGYEGGAWVKL